MWRGHSAEQRVRELELLLHEPDNPEAGLFRPRVPTQRESGTPRRSVTPEAEQPDMAADINRRAADILGQWPHEAAADLRRHVEGFEQDQAELRARRSAQTRPRSRATLPPVPAPAKATPVHPPSAPVSVVSPAVAQAKEPAARKKGGVRVSPPSQHTAQWRTQLAEYCRQREESQARRKGAAPAVAPSAAAPATVTAQPPLLPSPAPGTLVASSAVAPATAAVQSPLPPGPAPGLVPDQGEGPSPLSSPPRHQPPSSEEVSPGLRRGLGGAPTTTPPSEPTLRVPVPPRLTPGRRQSVLLPALDTLLDPPQPRRPQPSAGLPPSGRPKSAKPQVQVTAWALFPDSGWGGGHRCRVGSV